MSGDENMDTEEECCDNESPKSDESEVEDSEHSTVSESEESSEADEDTIELRKHECIADGHELEKAFQLVKNLLYEERMKQIETRLAGLHSGTAPEYLKPLKQLEEKQERRQHVAAKRKELRLHMIEVMYESEKLAAHQNLENDKIWLFDTMRQELEEKIKRLEEDRQNSDIHSDIWESQLFSKKNKNRQGIEKAKERRKKPVNVIGPFIVYMLDEHDILDDWAIIKKALKQKQQVQKKLRSESAGHTKERYIAKYLNGQLNYRGILYYTGESIIIDNKEDSPVHAKITAINAGEIWVRKSDGNKSKLYIPQLQLGKYTIRHV